MKKRSRLALIFGLLILVLFLTWLFWPPRKVSLSELALLITQGQVQKIEIRGNHIDATSAGRILVAQKEDELSFLESMNLLGLREDQLRTIDIRVQPEGWFLSYSLLWVAIVLGLFAALAGVLLIWSRMLDKQKRAIAGPKFEPAGDTRTSFGDIAGYEDLREQAKAIVEYFQSPKAFADLRVVPPKNVLLVGPPGTGKTQLARAIANTAGVKFIPVSGSAFVEMFVGVGSKRVRDLFESANKEKPTIIFVDEIDAVARRRASTSFQSNMEHDHTLNEFLNQLDGFNQNDNVVFMCATNREDILDPALLQRMTLRIEVGLPKLSDRQKILNFAVGQNEIEGWNQDVETDIAIRTVGFSGRQLRNLIADAGWDCYKRMHRSARERCFTNGEGLITLPLPNSELSSPVALAGNCGPGNHIKLTLAGQSQITLIPEDGVWSHVAGLDPGKIKATAIELDSKSRVVGEATIQFMVQTQGRVGAQDVTAAIQRIGLVIPQIENRQELEQKLAESVGGQEHAIHTMVASAAFHYARARVNVDVESIGKSKSTVLLVGPHGCGKTTLVRSLAKQLGVPFASLQAEALLDWRDAVSAVDQLLRNLVRAASGAHNKASYGIACIENVQILGKNSEVDNRQAGQRLLSQLIRGDIVELALSKNVINPQEVTFDTSNLLIVLEGHFPQFEDTIIHDFGGASGIVLDRFSLAEFGRELGLDRVVFDELFAVVPLNPLTAQTFDGFLGTRAGKSLLDRLTRPASSKSIQLELSDGGMKELASKAEKLNAGYNGLEDLLETVIDHATNSCVSNSAFDIDAEFVTEALRAASFYQAAGEGKSFGTTLEERIVNQLKEILESENHLGE